MDGPERASTAPSLADDDTMTIRRTLGAAAALCFLAFPALAADRAPSAPLKPKVDCAAMAGWTVPAARIGLPTNGATIVTAVAKPASTGAAPADATPAYCELTGMIQPVDPKAPPINFQIVIPEGWRGRALQVGGNGSNGFIPNLVTLARGFQGSPTGPLLPPHTPFPIAQGYAAFGSDSGHGGALAPGPRQEGEPGARADPSWMRNNESYRNFGHEHIKKTRDVAQEVFKRMYGRPAVSTYFAGESAGGREALMAVGRYPQDYDGVIASVPLAYFAGLVSSHFLRIRDQLEPGAWVPPEKAPAIARETLRVCDELDGQKDGVILNYDACNRRFDVAFTPDPLASMLCPGDKDAGPDCLTHAQMTTVNSWRTNLYIGVPYRNGEVNFPGLPVGLEDKGGWIPLLRERPDRANPPRGPASQHLLVRYARSPAKGDLTRGSPQELQAEIADLSAIVDAPADWSGFIARGGKLILHASAVDYLTNPRATMALYDEAVRRQGKSAVDRGVRFYVTPYAQHNSAGVATGTGEALPRYVDLLGALAAWVEGGQAPGDLVQTLEDAKAPYAVASSRPLCRYPTYPRYRGSGDVKAAASYACTAP